MLCVSPISSWSIFSLSGMTLWLCKCAPPRAHYTALGWHTKGAITSEWGTHKYSEILLCQFPLQAPNVPLNSPGIEPSSLLCEAVYQLPKPLHSTVWLRDGCSNFPKAKSRSHLTFTGPTEHTQTSEVVSTIWHMGFVHPWGKVVRYLQSLP